VNEPIVSAQAIAATLAALDHVFALVRQVAVSRTDAAALRSGAFALQEALAAAQPPFALQFLPQLVLRDRVPLPLSLEAHRRAQQCIGALHRLGVQELVVEEVPDLSALIELCEALFQATNNQRSGRPQIAGLRLRALPQLQTTGAAADEIAVDRSVGDQIQLAFAEAQSICAHASTRGRWAWGEGRALAWRLERCMTASVSVTARALELNPAPWSPSRRALLCAFHVGAVLARLQVSPLAQRAATHAALALAACGLRERDGLEFTEAARAALGVLLRPNAEPLADPHRLRMRALMRLAAHEQTLSIALVPLLHAAYQMERRRCPADVPVRLSRLDLQAWLASALGSEVHPGFGRALLGLLGIVPVGSHVLEGGRLALVVAAGERGDPLRPRVLVGGEVRPPAAPVVLHSPLGMTPWAK
jgi:hypothetical protein